jgi:hypothetical protein
MVYKLKINTGFRFFTGKYWEFAHGASLIDTGRKLSNKLFMSGKEYAENAMSDNHP